MDEETLKKLKSYADIMSDGSSKTFLYSEICKEIEKANNKCGVFIRKIKFVRAEQVTVDWEEYTDKNGEKFIGLRNDFKLYDDEGNIYYINKHEFLINYAPFDKNAWNIVNDWKNRQYQEKQRIIENEQIKTRKED